MGDSGRFFVTSEKTGKTYVVEPDYGKSSWNVGGVTPKATGVKKKDTKITKPIAELPPGESPLEFIRKLEEE